MLVRAVCEIEVAGKVRGFKFGTYATAIASALEQCDLVEWNTRLSRGQLLTILHTLYGAAKAWCVSNNKEVDFTPEDVGGWIEELGLEKGLDLIRKGIEAPNSQAPETPGQAAPSASTMP